MTVVDGSLMGLTLHLSRERLCQLGLEFGRLRTARSVFRLNVVEMNSSLAHNRRALQTWWKSCC